MSSGSSPKALPHSEEAERAVLASVLLSPHVLPMLSRRLAEDDFYLEKHQLIYGSMLELQEDGTEIDLRTLQGHLELKNAFDIVGGMAYLAGLDLDLPDLGRVETYVEIVKERSVRRQIIETTRRIAVNAVEGGVAAREVLEEMEEFVLRVGHDVVARDLVSMRDAVVETAEAIELVDEGAVGIPSGLYDLDAMTQGLVPGNLIYVAGRPAMGKTSVAMTILRNVSIRDRRPAAMFSLEMSRVELTQRVLSAESGLPLQSVRSGEMSEEQWTRLYEAMREVSEAPLYLDDSSSPSLAEIGAKCRRMQMEHGLELVVVDYLQLMQGGKHETRELEISALSRGFKRLARELSVPIILLAQLSRRCEMRTDRRPMLSDLRGSGGQEQDADIVCFVYRDEVYHPDEPDLRGLAELIVAKHRNGPTGTVDLVFLHEQARFENLERVHGAPESFGW